jgi:K+ transport systems, NAD-binding component
MQSATLLLILSAFPAVVVPVLKESLSRTPPTSRDDLSNHVVVCTATTHTESLIDELTDREVPYIIVEPDRETATNLFERDREVVHGDPTSMETLSGINVETARAVVSDADDEVDMSVITTAKELAPEVPVYSIATGDDLVEYHELAGATKVFLPRELLGDGLANKVRSTVETNIEQEVIGGENIEVDEIHIRRGSRLDGGQLSENGIVDKTGASGHATWRGETREQTPQHVIGVWARGEFHVPPFQDITLDEQTVLLVAGQPKTLRSLAARAGSKLTQYGRGRVIVVDSGVVGTAVSNALIEDGIDRTVVDVEDEPQVDVVGDVTEEATYRKAGIETARTVVLALNDDTTTLVAAFVINNLAPDVEIVARANQTESVPKLYRAGAEYVLALSTVAGRLLATAILDSERTIALDEKIRIVRRTPGPFADQKLGEASIRERFGCSVIAIERNDGRFESDLRELTGINPDDHLILAGTDAALDDLNSVIS